MGTESPRSWREGESIMIDRTKIEEAKPVQPMTQGDAAHVASFCWANALLFCSAQVAARPGGVLNPGRLHLRLPSSVEKLSRPSG